MRSIIVLLIFGLINSANGSICLFAGFCSVDSDCVVGSICQRSNQFYTQCVPNPANTCTGYGGNCAASASCCTQYCSPQSKTCQNPPSCVSPLRFITPTQSPTVSPTVKVSLRPSSRVPTSVPRTSTPTVPTVQAAFDKCVILKKQAKTFIESSIYPTSAQIVAYPALTAGFLDPKIRTRITPIGSFDGLAGTVEYFYGLTSIFSRVVRQDIRRLVCEGNQVAIYTNTYFAASFPGTVNYPGSYNITSQGFLTFDLKTNLITSMEIVVPNFGFAMDIPATSVDPATNMTYHAENIAVICSLTVYGQVGGNALSPTGTCQGANNIWGSPSNLVTQFNTCYYFLSTQVPYGSYNRLNSNTVLCRLVHAQLTLFDPAMHCPHVSPAGGGACVDFTYKSFYQAAY